jgi:hypothetical protein
VIGRRGGRLFGGEDDLFSWVAAAEGLGFGVFPRLRVTHLISAGRLKRAHFLRLIHDQAFSHGVLVHLRGQARERKDSVTRAARLLLQGVRKGYFSMRCQLAAFRGMDAAERFIAERGLKPIRVGRGPTMSGGQEPIAARTQPMTRS